MDTLVLNPDAQPLGIVPLSVMTWEEAIKAQYQGHVEVIHTYPDRFVHSPSVTLAVPSVVMTRQFISIGRSIKFSKPNVYLRDRYTCAFCQTRFPAHALTWDHVVPRVKGGRTVWENMVAACANCNFKKAHHDEMKPAWKPYRPTYGQMMAIKQEEVIEIPDPQWQFYLQWPDDKVRYRGYPKNER